MRVVYILGGWRTGTTHAYGIALSIMRGTGLEFGFGGADATTIEQLVEYHRTHEMPVAIIKAHNVVPPAGGRVVLCTRSERDALASWIRIGKSPEVGARRIVEARRIAARLASRAPVILDYESLYGQDETKVRMIAVAIGITLTDQQVAAIAQQNDVAVIRRQAATMTEADPATELRPGHVGPQLGRPGAYRLPAHVARLLR